MSSDRIITLHPEGKAGVNIEVDKYDAVKVAIITSLTTRGPMTFSDLGTKVADHVGESFDGSISWYYTTVKLDLEARGMIRRIPGSRPQMIELVQH